jgi:hypothetical protein
MCFSRLIYTVWPRLIHTCHAAPMSCSDHTVLRKATAQDGRRETACGWPVRVRLLPATTRSSTNVVIRSIPISDAGGQCETKQRLSCTSKRVLAAHYKKRRSVKLLELQFGYFRLPCGLSRRTRHCRSGAGRARHGMCELTNGMGRAWARHAMCESAFTLPHVAALKGTSSGSTDITSVHGNEEGKAYLFLVNYGCEILCVLLITDVSMHRLLHRHLV